MRFEEFSSEVKRIKHIKKEFDKILQTLSDDYKIRLEIHKEKIKINRRERNKGELKASNPSRSS